MDTSALEDLGLSNAESRIYIALLESGPSKTGLIIDRTKLQSSTVYHILGSLIEKGLVSYVIKGKIKYYHAESPESLLLFLEEKKRKFNQILPTLRRKEELSKEKNTAKVYEGINGFKAAFNDVLLTMRQGEEYYFFQVGWDDLSDEKVRRFFRSYHLKRSEKGIKVKGLALRKAKKIMDYVYDLPHTKVRYINELLPTGLVIYKDKVITLDWKDNPTAFVIQSRSVADSYRKLFEEKWKMAKE